MSKECCLSLDKMLRAHALRKTTDNGGQERAVYVCGRLMDEWPPLLLQKLI